MSRHGSALSGATNPNGISILKSSKCLFSSAFCCVCCVCCVCFCCWTYLGSGGSIAVEEIVSFGITGSGPPLTIVFTGGISFLITTSNKVLLRFGICVDVDFCFFLSISSMTRIAFFLFSASFSSSSALISTVLFFSLFPDAAFGLVCCCSGTFLQ